MVIGHCMAHVIGRFIEAKSMPRLETNRSPPVVTDDPSETHRWTSEVASAAFAVATGGPPIIPPEVTESFTGGHRWKLIDTPLANNDSTGNQYQSQVGILPVCFWDLFYQNSDFRSYSIMNDYRLFSTKH